MRAQNLSLQICTIEEYSPESSLSSTKWDSSLLIAIPPYKHILLPLDFSTSSSFTSFQSLLPLWREWTNESKQRYYLYSFPFYYLNPVLLSWSQYLLKDLVERGVWTPEVRNQIIADRGSVQGVSAITQDVKDLYKTVWEIKQKAIIDQAADRGAFICQSQSLNIHMAEPTTARLTSMHFYAWKRGLKTGMYYLRTRPKGTYHRSIMATYDIFEYGIVTWLISTHLVHQRKWS